jgi:hypothetical protein
MGSYVDVDSYLESDNSDITGLEDAGRLIIKKDGSNAQFVMSARRQSMRAAPKKKKENPWIKWAEQNCLGGGIWGQQFMYSLNNAGWLQLISAMRKDDRVILAPLDEYDWLDLADEYRVNLTDEDLRFLVDEVHHNPYQHLEHVNE